MHTVGVIAMDLLRHRGHAVLDGVCGDQDVHGEVN
jgi:hypothetical protein